MMDPCDLALDLVVGMFQLAIAGYHLTMMAELVMFVDQHLAYFH